MDFFSAKSGFSENAEITLEANPESMTARKISQWKEVGINRLSIGVQTFDDDILSYIGRLADGKTAQESLATARKIGFSNINADLMFGLPFQTESGFLDDMRRCLEEGITHLSLYSLLSHEGDGLSLKMAQDHPPIPDERSLYDSASAFLERSGFSCYEISNFCREGFRSVHNMAYWLYEEYLGLGTSAVSRIGQLRWKNTCDESLYRQGLETGHFPVQETERLSLDDMEKEFIMTNLRTSEGLSFQRFASMFGKGFLEEYGEIVRELAGLGLIAQDEGGVRITQEGRFVSNSIILRFFG
jgi:oxygen-independent coproporphyrinogen-3 oxidase